MKKILFISNTANFSKFNRPFMRWFKSQGWIVDYCSNGEESVQDCDTQYSICMARSPFSLKNVVAYKKLKEIVKENHYDVVHCHTPMGGFLARLAFRTAYKKHETSVIYTAHGFHFYKGAPLINWLLFYPVEKYLSRFTNVIITINQEDYNRAKKKFHCPVEYVAGVGVDLKKFVPLSKEEAFSVRKTLNLSEDDFVITVVAECNKNKNQIMLIRNIPKLVKMIPKLKVLLVGKETLPDVRNTVKSLGLTKYITFLGYRNDVEKITSVSNIVFSASLREGLPVNIIEAMACAVPVVASHNRGHDSLINDGKTGLLFKVSDDAAMCNAIFKVYYDGQLCRSLGENASIEAKKYALDQILCEMIKIYDKYTNKQENK